MDKKVRLRVINPSSSKIEYVARKHTVTIPGHRFSDNPVDVELPVEILEPFRRHIRNRFAHIKILVGDAVEQTETTEPEPTEPTEAAVPEKEAFFTACKAQKESDAVWIVTVPDGREFRIENVAHHKQAKQAAYDKLYGGTEQS